MPHMQDIEAAISENELLPFSIEPITQGLRLSKTHHCLIVFHRHTGPALIPVSNVAQYEKQGQ